MLIIKKQEIVLSLRLFVSDPVSPKTEWELWKIIVKDDTGVKTEIYACYRNNVAKWIEQSRGHALTKFMHIIPNEIANP